MKEKTIEFKKVDMKFSLCDHKIDSLKEYFISIISKKIKYHDFYALKDISFCIYKGERIGLIGPNGSGKSTLLKLISNVMQPTSGEISIKGRIAPLLELGAGFDIEFSGEENIFINAAILGKDEVFIKEKYDEIVEFSELGRFINVPVKNYSSGMRAKLGFSIATIINPDILILDEILGVGDQRFKEKSTNRMREMIESGNTVIIASHRLEMIKELTDKTIWLDNGELVDFGDTEDVCNAYIEFSKGKNNAKQYKKL